MSYDPLTININLLSKHESNVWQNPNDPMMKTSISNNRLSRLNKEAEREDIKKKKSYVRAKKNLVRDHLFRTSAISISIQFWSKDNPLLDVFNWHSITLR